MPRLAEIQRFIVWLCGSLMVFGFIATMIAYLLYDDQASADCQVDDCKSQTDTVVVSANDNRILKIVAPTLIAVGLVIIVCVRCWQQHTNGQAAANETATENGEDNDGYHGPEFDFGAPPSYNDALHMEVVSEVHGSFPAEAPPKYDEALAQIEDISHSLEIRSELTINRDSSRHEVMEENVAVVQRNDDDDDDRNEESSETSSISEDAVSINDSQTIESTEISDRSNHNEQRIISSTDNSSVNEHEIRETRILVHQRDSCLSSADIQEFPERDSEQITSRHTASCSRLPNERLSHHRNDETLEVEADSLETNIVVHRGPNIFDNENQRSQTDMVAQSIVGRATEQDSSTSTGGGNALSSSCATITSVALSERLNTEDWPVSLEDSAAPDYVQVAINSMNIEPSSVPQEEQHANESTQQQGVFYV